MFPILNPPPTSLPVPSLWVIPVHQPQASCILHWTWTGDSFLIWYYTCFNAILPNHSTLSLSHRVQKTVLYICVSFLNNVLSTYLPCKCFVCLILIRGERLKGFHFCWELWFNQILLSLFHRTHLFNIFNKLLWSWRYILPYVIDWIFFLKIHMIKS